MIEIEHLPQRGRFQARIEGQLSVADYRLDGERMEMFHTEVPPALGGRGIAARLVKAALAHARERRLKVVPSCSYVRAYMRRHPEVHDLIA